MDDSFTDIRTCQCDISMISIISCLHELVPFLINVSSVVKVIASQVICLCMQECVVCVTCGPSDTKQFTCLCVCMWGEIISVFTDLCQSWRSAEFLWSDAFAHVYSPLSCQLSWRSDVRQVLSNEQPKASLFRQVESFLVYRIDREEQHAKP